MGTTLLTLRQDLGHNLFELHVGAVTAPTTTSFVDATLMDWRGSGNDKLHSAWVKVVSGSQAGTVRRVASYDDTTGRVLLSREWTAPAGGDEYELHLLLHPDDLDRAINHTLQKCYYVAFVEEVPVSGQRQYELNYSWLTDPSQIRQVYWRYGTYPEERYYPLSWWRVTDDAGTFNLHVRPSETTGTMLVLEAVLPYDELTADSLSTDCPPRWVLAGAEMEVYRLLAHRDPAKDASRYRELQMEAALRWQILSLRLSPRFRPRAQHPDSPWRNLSSDVVN